MDDIADLVMLGMMIIVAIAFAIASIVFPLWFILHRVLAPFDDVLLREPFFQKSEQLYCMAWPFSYWKTLIYICLIVAPSSLKKRRFKGLTEIPSVGRLTVIACKIQFWLMAFSGVMFFVYFGYGGFVLYILPHLQ